MTVKTFKFTAYGDTFTTEAPNHLVAMSEANHAFILGPGAWIDVSDTEFKWSSGNFFD